MTGKAKRTNQAYLFFISLITVFGGFFGYYKAVIPGTISMIKHLMTDIGVKQLEIDEEGFYDNEYSNFK